MTQGDLDLGDLVSKPVITTRRTLFSASRLKTGMTQQKKAVHGNDGVTKGNDILMEITPGVAGTNLSSFFVGCGTKNTRSLWANTIFLE